MKPISLIITFLFIASTAAKDWKEVKCPAPNNKVAKEAVKLILSGQLMPGSGKCLKQENFSFFMTYHSPPMDADPIKEITVSEKAQITIDNLETSEVGVHQVDFKVKDGKKVYKDRLRFTHQRDISQQMDMACYTLLDGPLKPLIYKSCR